mmetsp:Transcript_35572/g.65161  ORF Transcript_35572/g.65161 Transcript_35572/m.65161 type:complete len:94 (+) Transcript_35572:90-371(+)
MQACGAQCKHLSDECSLRQVIYAIGILLLLAVLTCSACSSVLPLHTAVASLFKKASSAVVLLATTVVGFRAATRVVSRSTCVVGEICRITAAV